MHILRCVISEPLLNLKLCDKQDSARQPNVCDVREIFEKNHQSMVRVPFQIIKDYVFSLCDLKLRLFGRAFIMKAA